MLESVYQNYYMYPEASSTAPPPPYDAVPSSSSMMLSNTSNTGSWSSASASPTVSSSSSNKDAGGSRASTTGPATARLSLRRNRLTTTTWEDEKTTCYMVDAAGICVTRRADNNMVNGTKLLNVVGISRGKRDGILKNAKGRVVVKVGPMSLKGVWIPLVLAEQLAAKYRIESVLYPLLEQEPSRFLGTCHDEFSAPNRPSGRMASRDYQTAKPFPAAAAADAAVAVADSATSMPPLQDLHAQSAAAAAPPPVLPPPSTMPYYHQCFPRDFPPVPLQKQ